MQQPVPDLESLIKRWDSVMKSIVEVKEEVADLKLKLNSANVKSRSSQFSDKVNIRKVFFNNCFIIIVFFL